MLSIGSDYGKDRQGLRSQIFKTIFSSVEAEQEAPCDSREEKEEAEKLQHMEFTQEANRFMSDKLR